MLQINPKLVAKWKVVVQREGFEESVFAGAKFEDEDLGWLSDARLPVWTRDSDSSIGLADGRGSNSSVGFANTSESAAAIALAEARALADADATGFGADEIRRAGDVGCSADSGGGGDRL